MAGTVLADFIYPSADDQSVIVEWSEAGWIHTMSLEAQGYIDHGTKLMAEAGANGKAKWEAIMSETHDPATLVAGFVEMTAKMAEAETMASVEAPAIDGTIVSEATFA